MNKKEAENARKLLCAVVAIAQGEGIISEAQMRALPKVAEFVIWRCLRSKITVGEFMLERLKDSAKKSTKIPQEGVLRKQKTS